MRQVPTPHTYACCVTNAANQFIGESSSGCCTSHVSFTVYSNSTDCSKVSAKKNSSQN